MLHLLHVYFLPLKMSDTESVSSTASEQYERYLAICRLDELLRVFNFSSFRFGFKCFLQFVICVLSPLPSSLSSVMSGYNNQKENKKGDETPPKSPEVQESDDEADPEAAPSGVNNLLFNIHGTTSQEDYDRLREVFDALSLDDQLTVALNMEEQMEFAKERLAAIKSSKEVEKEMKASKRGNKEKVDRSKSNVITLYVKVARHPEMGQKTIVVNRNGKCGQIRKQVCMVFGLKASAKTPHDVWRCQWSQYPHEQHEHLHLHSGHQ